MSAGQNVLKAIIIAWKDSLWTYADKYDEKNEENKPCNDAGNDNLSFLSYPPVQVHIFTPWANVTILAPKTKTENRGRHLFFCFSKYNRTYSQTITVLKQWDSLTISVSIVVYQIHLSPHLLPNVELFLSRLYLFISLNHHYLHLL